MDNENAQEVLQMVNFRGNRNVLLLNFSEEIIGMIPWERAVTLMFSEKAMVPYNYDHTYTIKISNENTFEIPSALILKQYTQIPYRPFKPTRKNIYRRDGMMCQYTGKMLKWEDASIDHIIPVSRGGKHVWNNVVTCCKKVNIRKANKTPEEARLQLKSKPRMPTIYEIVRASATEDQLNAWSRWLG